MNAERSAKQYGLPKPDVANLRAAAGPLWLWVPRAVHTQASLVVVILLIDLVATVGSASAASRSITPTGASVSVQKSIALSSSWQQICKSCVSMEERAWDDIAAMVPGRSWVWQSDVERSRNRLDQLQRSLALLQACEEDFEAQLSTQQQLRAKANLTSIRRLLQELDSDEQSLTVEFRQRYPARWHVAQLVSHMQAEIRKWKALHKQVAAELGTKRRQ